MQIHYRREINKGEYCCDNYPLCIGDSIKYPFKYCPDCGIEIVWHDEIGRVLSEDFVNKKIEWKPMDTAPRDGTVILGMFDVERNDVCLIRWSERRTCMLGGAQGSYGAGWEDEYNHLPVETPLFWSEEI